MACAYSPICRNHSFTARPTACAKSSAPLHSTFAQIVLEPRTFSHRRQFDRTDFLKQKPNRQVGTQLDPRSVLAVQIKYSGFVGSVPDQQMIARHPIGGYRDANDFNILQCFCSSGPSLARFGKRPTNIA